MSLREYFPEGVHEIPLSYLSLPELLARENEDEVIQRTLGSPNFWRNLLMKQYGISKEEAIELDDPRAEYRQRYLDEATESGALFELGQGCLSLTDDEKKRIRDLEPSGPREFLMGSYLAGCEKLPPEKVRLTERFQLISALHHGEAKELPKKYSPAHISFYSREMIDHALEMKVASASNIFRFLAAQSSFSNGQVYLLEYLLERYRHLLSPTDVKSALRRFQIQEDRLRAQLLRRPDTAEKLNRSIARVRRATGAIENAFPQKEK
jgi:Trp operon repressor